MSLLPDIPYQVDLGNVLDAVKEWIDVAALGTAIPLLNANHEESTRTVNTLVEIYLGTYSAGAGNDTAALKPKSTCIYYKADFLQWTAAFFELTR